MSQWKDKVRKDWRYSFQYRNKRYAAGGFEDRREAKAAEAARRKALRLGVNIKNGSLEVIPRKDTEYILEDSITDRFSLLERTYQDFLKDPMNGLPELVDMMMKDFSLPYTYKDILKITRDYYKHGSFVPAKMRLEILKRDNFTCKLCGRTRKETSLHVDHIRPSSRGGLTEPRNLRTLCRDCNLGKSDFHFAVV